ncbi:MAG: PIN domain-containing protein [Aquificales bacterium]|nr:PIN domain-containing protein [Aquificales bacterium]
MSLFVDSSAWIGLFGSADKYYQLASRAFSTLSTQPQQLFTSDYVIDETLTHILITYGRPNALRFGHWVLSASFVDIFRVDEGVWQAAWEMFQSYDDKQWAFTDCTSFVLMRQHNLHRAFTFDHHFEQAGFQLWPGMDV